MVILSRPPSLLSFPVPPDQKEFQDDGHDNQGTHANNDLNETICVDWSLLSFEQQRGHDIPQGPAQKDLVVSNHCRIVIPLHFRSLFSCSQRNYWFQVRTSDIEPPRAFESYLQVSQSHNLGHTISDHEYCSLISMCEPQDQRPGHDDAGK